MTQIDFLVFCVKERVSMKLSKREREILSYIPYGFTDKEIALRLGISIRTVQTHVNRILMKLGARNRVNAACLFMQKYKDFVLDDQGCVL